MKFKFILIISALILNYSEILGQQKINSLKIGDQLPVFKIPKIINYSKRSALSTEFTNNLLILDFWGLGCKTCIEAMPKMALLEKKIGPKLIILPVATYEKEAQILDFWKNNKYTRNLSTPSVVEDKILSSYFPSRFVPHEVWIYKGKVIAITDLEHVDEYNIRKVINGEKINFPLKYDFYSYNRNVPLFNLDTNQVKDGTLLNYAAISDYRHKINSLWMSGGSGIFRDTIKKTVRAFFLNQPILNSYILEFYHSTDSEKLIKPSSIFQPNQIIWKVSDRNKYVFEKRDGTYTQDWVEKNGICFESIYSDTGQTDLAIHKSIIKDLNRLLSLNVRWEKVKETVMIITKLDSKTDDKLGSKTASGKYSIYDLVNDLNEISTNPYVFNESGDELSDVPMENIPLTNMAAVSKRLLSYGFVISEEVREVHKLIFSEITDGGILQDSTPDKVR